jgi:uncharacterized protein
MQLTEHQPGNHHAIRRVDDSGILIDDQLFSNSLIVGARLLEPDWPVNSLTQLTAETIAPLLRLDPELVVIGIGQRQQFPAVDVQREFLRRGIGFECMTLDAACRTFNILMSENRRALAGLIIQS